MTARRRVSVVHLAAAPEGLVQRCARCREVLIDRTREARLEGDTELHWWEGSVLVRGASAAAIAAPPDCELAPCSRCDGRGSVMAAAGGYGDPGRREPCPACFGTGSARYVPALLEPSS